MGLLVGGIWQDRWYDTKSTGGRFVRTSAGFRNWITADGSSGPTGEGDFAAEGGRYHLYVSLACPWAHRALIMRRLKGLEAMIGISAVHWRMLDHGWTFEDGSGVVPDPIHGARYLHQVYTAAKPDYSGRVTVPALWDKTKNTIVSNESAEIIRMMNSGFRRNRRQGRRLLSRGSSARDRTLNTRIYDHINNGVYKAGFATTQQAYEEAVRPLFKALDDPDERLSSRRYLCGDRLTEADIRLFTTLVRFNPVYVGHFKCKLRRIADYPHLSGYLRDLYQTDGIAETVNMAHIKGHYYESHRTINPTGIVPLGPTMDLDAPHGRVRVQGR